MNMDVSEQPQRLRVKSRPRLVAIVVAAIIALLVVGAVAVTVWYRLSLQPVATTPRASLYTLDSGRSVRQVADELQSSHLIRSRLAFRIYMRLHGGAVKAGSYHLNQDMSVATIAALLISGKQSNYDITFYPGATLRPISTTPQAKRMDITSVLERAGFSDQEIQAALMAHYDSPLFAGKPAQASLEGYVYGDTYQIDSAASAASVLQTTFDTFWQRISENDLVNRLKKRGFDLYQGITLASIVQAEASHSDDQRQIAQVFELRLQKKMPLGSDVTFMYAANQLGVPASPTLKSPYNTRIHSGLPPGPINSPSIGALEAVAQPAKGDYLYFVAGDDGQIHYAKTADQHQLNIEKYCTKLCK